MSNNSFLKQSVLISSLLLLVSLKGFSLSTIVGSAPNDPGRTIFLAEKPFQMSEQLSVLDNSSISENGAFRFQIDLSEAKQFFLIVRNRIAEIIVQPDAHYLVTFPDFAQDQAQRLQFNPVALAFEDLPETDSNQILAACDAAYDRFYSQAGYDLALSISSGSAYRNSRSNWLSETDLTALRAKKKSQDTFKPDSKIDSLFAVFSDEVDELRPLVNSVYAEKYLEYVFGQVAYDMAYVNYRELQDFIEVDLIKLNHPEAIKLLQLAYAPILNKIEFGEEYPTFRAAVNTHGSWDKMLKVLLDEEKVRSDENTELIALVMMKMAINHPDFRPLMVLKTINDLAESKSPLAPEATRIIEDELHARRGMTIPDFQLLNEREELKTAEDYNTNWTYFLFFNSRSTASMQEMILLEKLHQKFGRQVDFVSICMDDNPDALRNFLAQHPNYRWQFLYGGSSPLLLQDFGVTALPYAMLFNPEGMLQQTISKKPSEGAEAWISKLLQQKIRDLRIKVWDD